MPALRDIADTVFRVRKLILIGCAIFTLAIVGYLLLTPRMYESEMTILVKNKRAEMIVSADGSSSVAQATEVNDSQIGTEVQLLSSRELYAKVVDQGGLAGPTPASKEKAVQKLQQKIRVAPLMKSSMIRVRYASPDPQQSARVLRLLAEVYLERQLELHSSVGSFAFFEKQAAVYETQLRDAEARLIEFQKSSGVVGAPQQKELLVRRVIEQQSALREAQAASSEAQRRVTTLQSQMAAVNPRITTQSRRLPNQYSVERLNTLIAELQNKRTELLVKFRPDDRMVKQIDQQITDTQAALEGAQKMNATEEATDVNPLSQSVQAELSRAQTVADGLRGRISTLSQQTQQYRSELETLGGILPGEQELLRDIKVAEENYLLYSRKREEARIGEAMDKHKFGNVAVVEPASVPVLPQPKLSAGLAAAIVLGILLIVITVTVLGHSRRTAFTPWELEAMAGAPVLATVAFVPNPGSNLIGT
jgi:uncharacterized protein involved in exopolysaccharide biosynthesis